MLAEIGHGHPIVAVTAAMHGNEEVGVYILDDLRRIIRPEKLLKGTLRLVVANPPALFGGTRFISEDLNRAFPGGRSKDSIESRLAPQVFKTVRDSDYAIDLHSTTSETEAFAIVDKKDPARVRLAEVMGIQNILLIPRDKDYAMIDFVKCGVGIELGPHGSDYSYEMGMRAVKNTLHSLGMISSREFSIIYEYLGVVDHVGSNYYELFGNIKYPPHSDDKLVSFVHNFNLVKRGDEVLSLSMPRRSGNVMRAEDDFYPVFVKEASYDTFCLKAKKISREEMKGER